MLGKGREKTERQREARMGLVLGGGGRVAAGARLLRGLDPTKPHTRSLWGLKPSWYPICKMGVNRESHGGPENHTRCQVAVAVAEGWQAVSTPHKPHGEPWSWFSGFPGVDYVAWLHHRRQAFSSAGATITGVMSPAADWTSFSRLLS